MAGKRFSTDFDRIDEVKPNDAVLVEDSSDGVVKYATPSQINEKFDQLVADIDTAIEAAGTATTKALEAAGSASDASDSADAAAGSAGDAAGSAELAEQYAKGTKGGTPVASGEEGYEDNAKYYKQLAEAAKALAESAQQAAEQAAQGAATAGREAALEVYEDLEKLLIAFVDADADDKTTIADALRVLDTNITALIDALTHDLAGVYSRLDALDGNTTQQD